MLSLVSVGTGVICTRTGSVAPMVKLSVIFPNLSSPLTDRLSLVLLLLSVTAMVQLSYVPSFNAVELSGCVRVTVLLFPDDADDEDELPQAPPYVMVPASFEEKV